MDREAGTADSPDTGGTATDASSRESASADRWRRLGDRSEALLVGAVKFWQHVRELWTRMANALHEEELRRPSFRQSSGPPRRHTERRDAPGPIRVPARGGVFNFTLDATFTWSSDRLSREALSGFAHYYLPEVIGRLTHLAAEHAGRFAPHRAAQLEATLQQVLADDHPWRYPQHESVVECAPQIRVRPDERAMQIAKPYWEQLIRIGCEFDVRKTRAEYAEQLSRQVVTILENLADSLPDGQRTNGKLAGDLERLLAEHRATLRRLEDELRKTLRDSDIFGRAASGDAPTEQSDGKPPKTPGPPDAATTEDDSPRDPNQPGQD